MARESTLNRRIGTYLRENKFMVQRIENEVGEGVPDTMCIRDGITSFVENKLAKVLPKRPDTPVFKSLNHGLLNEQEIWIEHYVRHGGKAYILAGYQRTLWLVPGRYANKFNGYSLADLKQFEVKKEDLPIILGSK